MTTGPHGMLLPPTEPGAFLGARAGRKIQMAPSRFLAETDRLDERLEQARQRLDAGAELLLFSKRERTTHNTWMHNVPEFVRGKRRTNYAYLNPADARSRGIDDGDLVRVQNAIGAIVLPARVTNDVVQGAVAVPHGWGHQGAPSLSHAHATTGRNVNDLAADGVEHTEVLSGMTHLNGVYVRVEPAGGAARVD